MKNRLVSHEVVSSYLLSEVSKILTLILVLPAINVNVKKGLSSFGWLKPFLIYYIIKKSFWIFEWKGNFWIGFFTFGHLICNHFSKSFENSGWPENKVELYYKPPSFLVREKWLIRKKNPNLQNRFSRTTFLDFSRKVVAE